MREEQTWREPIRTIRGAVSVLEEGDIPVAEMPDAAGEVRHIERRLAELRHRWNEEQLEATRDPEGEFGPPTLERTQFGTVTTRLEGAEYRTVTTRTARRTYNTAAILHGVAAALAERNSVETSEVDALLFSMRAGVASVSWKWTPLQRLARDLGLPLRTVPHAIPDDGDLDAPWIGEQWKETVRQEAVTA